MPLAPIRHHFHVMAGRKAQGSIGLYADGMAWRVDPAIHAFRAKKFFFEKKNQKTFAPGGIGHACRLNPPPGDLNRHASPKPPANKSFFGSFFSKKELLSFT